MAAPGLIHSELLENDAVRRIRRPNFLDGPKPERFCLKDLFGNRVQRNFHPAILGTAFGGIVACNRFIFTMPDCS